VTTPIWTSAQGELDDSTGAWCSRTSASPTDPVGSSAHRTVSAPTTQVMFGSDTDHSRRGLD
jgi:hypothetical protein